MILTRRDNRRGMADGPMRREWRLMTYRVTESGPYTFILSHSPETDLRSREKGRITESEQYESQDRAYTK